jgi:hypothetical protein
MPVGQIGDRPRWKRGTKQDGTLDKQLGMFRLTPRPVHDHQTGEEPPKYRLKMQAPFPCLTERTDDCYDYLLRRAMVYNTPMKLSGLIP